MINTTQLSTRTEFISNISYKNSELKPKFSKEEGSCALTVHRFSIITPFKNAWNFLVSLFASCFSIFKKEGEGRDTPEREQIQEVKVDSNTDKEEISLETVKSEEKPKAQNSEGVEQKRRMRPTRFERTGEKVESIFIEDDKIVEKAKIVRTKTLVVKDFNWKVTVYYTSNEKAIIQQISAKGSFEAAKYMLFLDHGSKFDLKRLAGIASNDIPTTLPHLASQAASLKNLRQLILKNGSAIVTVNGSIGKHHIIVDHVSSDYQHVRLRDPFHGWEITILSSDFYIMWVKEEKIIQFDHSYELLTPLEISSIEKEIGLVAARQNALKVLSFRNHFDKAIVIEGEEKTLCMENKQGVFHAYYFKNDKMYTFNDKGMRTVKDLKRDEKIKLISSFAERKIDLSRVRGLVPNN